MKKGKEPNESEEIDIEEGLIRSYWFNDEIVEKTYAKIKEILLNVAKNRGIDVSENETFELDELLNEIINVPEELTDFDVLYYKDISKLNIYIETKTADMTLDEIEKLLIEFKGFNGIGGMSDSFRSFMEGYIPKIIHKIGKLNEEIQDKPEINYDDSVFFQTDEFDDKDDILESEEIIEDDSIEDIDWESGWDFGDSEEKFDFAQNDEDDRNTTDSELVDFIKYVNIYHKLYELKMNGKEVNRRLEEIFDEKKLQEFYDDKKFMKELQKIMEHDKNSHTYYFHGTQDLESAEMIMHEGLGMMRSDLESTSYREFSIDNIILYQRGFGGEIGRDAIVIIDEPIENEEIKKIVEPIPIDKKIHFCPSGLQGLDGEPQYIVNSQYIVGYVDKKNKQIIFNPRYYDFKKFKLEISSDIERPKDLPYTEERIADGVLNANIGELLTENKKDKNNSR